MNKTGHNLDNLSEEEYKVTQEKGTEPRFSGEYLEHQEDGKYACVVCGVDLFSSDAKYDSGSGWPSFSDAITENIKLREDRSKGVQRTEVVCANCGAHLGHVFDDGPPSHKATEGQGPTEEDKPGVPATGKRYCINSAALNFEEGE